MPADDPTARILAELRRDSRIPNATLAERVGLSPSSCWRRVRALEETGAIRRYTVDLDDDALGDHFKAIVHVNLERHDQALVQDFIRMTRTTPAVRACYATTGAADYHLHVTCRDLPAYNRFLDDHLLSLPAVKGAQTFLVLKTIKDDGLID
ncbi:MULTISPECIES: Lrp/AsnC family transcriptional regulator [Paracoccus]|uniref:Lrp/AsnC family transcriptional regulator n=1 Tax=Paracoccus TaxID=265 RepID=UPI00086DA42A|nr:MULTISPECIES: Lrp/AsnC family transcriptional regulator [Paracoccus]ODT59190.1 MAG: AsnC family transcriptional regulator [Paracoccus sp. SCN 68-21]